MLLGAVLTAYLVWPQARTPQEMASEATDGLRSWRGVTYAGTVADSDGVTTSVRVTVRGDGTSYGTLSRAYGAQAQIAVGNGRTLLRGNRQWRLWDEPGSADSLADTWIADPPERISGLLPPSGLTPKALAGAVSEGTAGKWRQAGTASVNGRDARMLINGAVQIWVTAEPPHRLLSVGLSTTGASGQDAKPPSAFTTAAFTTTDNRRPPRNVRVQYAAARDQTPPSSLSSTVREASGAEAQSTAAAVKRLGETQAKPAELSERVTVQPDVSVHLRNISGSPCGSRTCSSVVTVTNEGLAVLTETADWAVAGLGRPGSTRRALALSTTLTLAKARCARDPEARKFETWEAWVTAMQTGSALFAAATAPEGSSVSVRIREQETSLPSIGPESCVNAGAWVTSFNLALVCRENARLKKPAEVPISLLRASGAVYEEYIYSWVEALQDFWLGRREVGDKLVAAVDGTNPEVARSVDSELLSQILYPPIILFHRYLQQDHEEFNSALNDALRWHKEYWSAAEERATDAEGLVALGPLAVACLAHDAGFPLEIESEYLPRSLLEFSWAGEIAT
ncbi:immunity 49 family protein [Streptomyces sp. NBC_00984]|uniref:immunity 49 family protein n=1 Tax=Streptomyces sp. NBC_00984 TaxID=2903700 RepID=UPI003867F241|nr:immunity 49 family protein [Streptomyces sp. NBC_00984]